MSQATRPSVAGRMFRVVVVTGCLLTVAHGLALAHAMLLAAEPAAGSVLTHWPPRIRLSFSEPVDPTVSGIRIMSSGAPGRDLAVRGDPHDVSAIVAQLDSLGPGEHRVVWRTVSADGHKVSGNYLFTIRGDTARAAQASAPPPMPDDSVSTTATLVGAPAVAAPLRGLAIACMMALAGLLLFSRRATVTGKRADDFAVWLSIAALVLAAAHFLAWTINTAPEHHADLAWMRAVADTAPGHMELARLAMVALTAWALVIARRPLAGLMFAASALVVSAAIGHPAAIHPLVAIPVNAVHLCAAAAWLGGLLWLIVADRADLERYSSEARKVSGVALVSVVLVVLSGVTQTLLFAGAPPQLLHTTYGKVVMIKVLGVFILVCFGAYHRYKLVPHAMKASTVSHLRDSVRFEVGVFILVVLLGGLLAYIPPHGNETTMTDGHGAGPATQTPTP